MNDRHAQRFLRAVKIPVQTGHWHDHRAAPFYLALPNLDACRRLLIGAPVTREVQLPPKYVTNRNRTGNQVNDILALFSSARRDGNTGRLIDRVARDLPLEVIDLAEKRIATYTYDHRHRDDDFEPLMTHLLTFDRLLFASPVYWYSVTAPMKTFLDRISDYLDLPELLDQGRRLREKTAYVICTSVMEAPAPSFIDAFQQTFEYLGMRFGGYVHANCVDGYVPERYETDVAAFTDLIRT